MSNIGFVGDLTLLETNLSTFGYGLKGIKLFIWNFLFHELRNHHVLYEYYES